MWKLAWRHGGYLQYNGQTRRKTLDFSAWNVACWGDHPTLPCVTRLWLVGVPQESSRQGELLLVGPIVPMGLDGLVDLQLLHIAGKKIRWSCQLRAVCNITSCCRPRIPHVLGPFWHGVLGVGFLRGSRNGRGTVSKTWSQVVFLDLFGVWSLNRRWGVIAISTHISHQLSEIAAMHLCPYI